MKAFTYVIDIDDTINITDRDENNIGLYSQSRPILKVINKIRRLKKEGHKIILFTARGMRTFNNDVKKIEDFHRETLVKWLNDHEVPYDELQFGKPWGPHVIYVDDRAVTINQFVLGGPENHRSYTHINKTVINDEL